MQVHVILYAEAIKWILSHMVNTNLIQRSSRGSDISTYHGNDMNSYYNMIKPNEYANTHLYVTWENINTKEIIKSRCQELARFCDRPSTIYPNRTLKKVCQVLIAMCCGLHVSKNEEIFKENRIFFLNSVFMRGKVFNWENIHSYEIQYVR